MPFGMTRTVGGLCVVTVTLGGLQNSIFLNLITVPAGYSLLSANTPGRRGRGEDGIRAIASVPSRGRSGVRWLRSR